MKLPELPKLRRNKEADVRPLVDKWLCKNYPKSVAYEVKVKGGKIYEHQPIALKQVEDGLFSYKPPDMGRRNPFDGIILKNADALLIICDGRLCSAYTYDNEHLFDFKV